jgi:hypothetical protein
MTKVISRARVLALQVFTKADINGNSRRGWMIFKGVEYLGFVDCGYAGFQAVRARFPHAFNVVASIPTTVRYYRTLKREHGL